MEEKKKKNFRPPGWLITRLPELVIDGERAQKLEALREKMCDTWGEDNEVASLTALQLKAIDLLLMWEGALLTKVEYDTTVQPVSEVEIEAPEE